MDDQNQNPQNIIRSDDSQNNAQPIVSHDNQNITREQNLNTYPENQVPTAIANPAAQQPIASDNMPSNKSHKKLIISLLLIVVLVLAVGGVFAFHNDRDKSMLTTPSVAVKATTVASSGLLTYVSQDNANLIVTNYAQKILAKVANPSATDELGVQSNNGQDVLIEAAPESGNNIKEYLVNNKGIVTTLPSSITSPNVTGSNYGGWQYLGYSNNYLENSCTSNSYGEPVSCYLDSVNLSTGAVSVITSATHPPSDQGADPPMSILGVSPNNVAYVILEGGDSNTSTLEEVNINTKQVVKTVSLPYLQDGTNDQPYQAISNDFNSFAYVVSASGAGDYQIDITNLTTGKTSVINDQCSGSPGYGVGTADSLYWSFDNTKLAYDCDNSNISFMAYITVSSDSVSLLKSMTMSSLQQPTLNNEGWASNSTIDYYYGISASTVHSNPSQWSLYSFDTSNSKITQNPSPAGYVLDTSAGA